MEEKKLKCTLLTPMFSYGANQYVYPEINMPNRLVAEFEGYSKGQLRDTADRLSSNTRKTFLQVSLALLQEAGIGEDGLKMANKQLSNFLETYWLFEPFAGIDYPTAYQNLFTALHDVKSVRSFEQNDEPWGRKCTLFPEYNAIFVKGHEEKGKIFYPYNTNVEYIYDISENKCLHYAIKENEALSAIALVKRVYNEQETNIYSIRQMLLKNSIYSDENKELIQLVMDEQQMDDDIANVVYELYHGNSWSDDFYPPEAVGRAKQLYEVIQKHHIPLSSYYGLVKFDGDNMGEVFRQLDTVQEQQELSRKISQFAHEAPGILLKYHGLPVFAGGEDFLGFLPLDSLFDCLQELYKNFLGTTEGLTFSAGIHICRKEMTKTRIHLLRTR